MRISPVRADEYSGWAEEFYNPALPYHNWHHAEEVMAGSLELINAKGGRWTRQVNRPLLQIAAAWHDVGHDHEERLEYESSEHYSVHLMRQRLRGEVSRRHLAVMEESILGTRYRAPRDTMAAVALHYADVGNMAHDYGDFLAHTTALWSEQGTPEWQVWRDTALGVLAVTAREAPHELPYIGVDGFDFAERIQENADRLNQEKVLE